jgi:hypothetical protein
MSPGFLAKQLERHSDLARTYRFHIDSWCLDRFYPRVGDNGYFGSEELAYRGLPLDGHISLGASTNVFLWRLYELTGDADYARVLYRNNDRSTRGLPTSSRKPIPNPFRPASSARSINTERN